MEPILDREQAESIPPEPKLEPDKAPADDDTTARPVSTSQNSSRSSNTGNVSLANESMTCRKIDGLSLSSLPMHASQNQQETLISSYVLEPEPSPTSLGHGKAQKTITSRDLSTSLTIATHAQSVLTQPTKQQVAAAAKPGQHVKSSNRPSHDHSSSSSSGKKSGHLARPGQQSGRRQQNHKKITQPTNLLVLMKETMTVMWKHNFSWPFHRPVDVQTLNIPDYDRIVANPMDMGTIKHKLAANSYMSSNECMSDLSLMFMNCYVYNKPTEDVVLMGQAIEKLLFEQACKFPRDEHECDITLISKPAQAKDQLQPVRKSLRVRRSSSSDRSARSSVMTSHRRAPTAPAADSGAVTVATNVVCAAAVNVDAGRQPTATDEPGATWSSAAAKPARAANAAGTTGIIIDKSGIDQWSVGGGPMSGGPSLSSSSSKCSKRIAKKNMKTTSKQSSSVRVDCETLSKNVRPYGELLNDLFSSSHEDYAWPFYRPVDEKCLTVKDYFDIIKKPMDMTTIKQKMETGQYNANSQEFIRDFRLIFSNCYRYNGSDSEISMLGKKLEMTFEGQIKRMVVKTNMVSEKPASVTNIDLPIFPEHLDLDFRSSDQLVTVVRQLAKEAEEYNKRVNLVMSQVRAALTGRSNCEVTMTPWVPVTAAAAAGAHNPLSSGNGDKSGGVSLDRKRKRTRVARPSSAVAAASRPPSIMSIPEDSQSLMDIKSSVVTVDHHRDDDGGRQAMDADGNISAVIDAVAASSSAYPKSAVPKPRAPRNPNRQPTKRMTAKKRHAQSNAMLTRRGYPTVSDAEMKDILSYDDKRDLSFKVNLLPGDKLGAIVEIIQIFEPKMRYANTDELEIDFESLDNPTLKALEKYVDSLLAQIGNQGQQPESITEAVIESSVEEQIAVSSERVKGSSICPVKTEQEQETLSPCIPEVSPPRTNQVSDAYDKAMITESRRSGHCVGGLTDISVDDMQVAAERLSETSSSSNGSQRGSGAKSSGSSSPGSSPFNSEDEGVMWPAAAEEEEERSSDAKHTLTPKRARRDDLDAQGFKADKNSAGNSNHSNSTGKTQQNTPCSSSIASSGAKNKNSPSPSNVADKEPIVNGHHSRAEDTDERDGEIDHRQRDSSVYHRASLDDASTDKPSAGGTSGDRVTSSKRRHIPPGIVRGSHNPLLKPEAVVEDGVLSSATTPFSHEEARRVDEEKRRDRENRAKLHPKSNFLLDQHNLMKEFELDWNN